MQVRHRHTVPREFSRCTGHPLFPCFYSPFLPDFGLLRFRKSVFMYSKCHVFPFDFFCGSTLFFTGVLYFWEAHALRLNFLTLTLVICHTSEWDCSLNIFWVKNTLKICSKNLALSTFVMKLFNLNKLFYFSENNKKTRKTTMKLAMLILRLFFTMWYVYRVLLIQKFQERLNLYKRILWTVKEATSTQGLSFHNDSSLSSSGLWLHI